MRKNKIDPQILDHLEWIGFVRPVGLVVSAPALIKAGAILDRRDSEGQNALRTLVETGRPSFRAFAKTVLGWRLAPSGYAEGDDIPVELQASLADGGELLKPDFAVRELEPKGDQLPWQLIVRELPTGAAFDKSATENDKYELSPHGKMERHLRQIGVTAGILFNGDTLRLISAPRGESSGWIDFNLQEMAASGGRPISTAVRMLLSEQRLLALPRHQRLAALLEDSRKFQNEVSERLAEQVLHALYELLRGFQAAQDGSHGELLKEVLDKDPDLVYRALLTVILRIVFLLYAEERDMLPEDETFLRYYSVAGLFERLREDASLFPDTMDARFGAWAQLLVLFRMLYDGAEYGAGKLPKRHGDLFDPERYPFLEGRNQASESDAVRVPLVPDGTVYRALEKLLVLDGERLSYRALDVEQIGSVYETMMGFRIETAEGRSVAIRAEKRHGAPTTVNLEALLAEQGAKRDKWLQDYAGRKLSDSVKKAAKDATSLEGLHSALAKVIDHAATPDWVPSGAMILQPSEERRRSGSHYTPRSLTEPIVRTTLEPIFARLRRESGGPISPEQVLELKVCDPAMGSGAFLVEACRQLGEALIESWRASGVKPNIPPDEDEVVYARRLIAQRCLYGVDKNPMATDLAKVSIWLATLAKDHAFTFLDHALRCGDSLVGLDRLQLWNLHWEKSDQMIGTDRDLPNRIARARQLRTEIAEAGEEDHDRLQEKLAESERVLTDLRLLASAVVAAYFLGSDRKTRDLARLQVVDWARALISKREHRKELELYVSNIESEPHPITPFHWEFEFPEVFLRTNKGFDAIVGNPPFAGKNTLADGNRNGYPTWLQTIHTESHGNADLVAHFFRRTFALLRKDGALGLIATNTIGQGDTRSTGLRVICQSGGTIYAARKRVNWPGQAAVIVSVVHVFKGLYEGERLLDGREVNLISAFLFHRGGNNDPKQLQANAGKSFQGSIVLGMGFTFDDTDKTGVANPISEMNRLIEENPRNADVIFPYIGGEEVNSSPTHSSHRYVINFGERSEEECRRNWPDLIQIVDTKVRPERRRLGDNPDARRRREYWWQFGRATPSLDSAVHASSRVLAISRVGQHCLFAFLGKDHVFSESLVVVPDSVGFNPTQLQSRVHEAWARFLGSSMKDDLRYTPSDCFETFPFTQNGKVESLYEVAGKEYFDHRSRLMLGNNEGLTKTYNRFHDPEERDPGILKLRELHAAMDRAVLDAYGWTDIPTDCEFILDYEEEDDESETTGRKKKKPWRYRWPDDIRDEVLARLLELNAKRAEEEELVGVTANKRTAKRTAKAVVDASPRLIDIDEE